MIDVRGKAANNATKSCIPAARGVTIALSDPLKKIGRRKNPRSGKHAAEVHRVTTCPLPMLMAALKPVGAGFEF